jgi:hypothetical protein
VRRQAHHGSWSATTAHVDRHGAASVSAYVAAAHPAEVSAVEAAAQSQVEDG